MSAVRIVDPEAQAKIVEPVAGAGKAPPGQHQRIDHAALLQGCRADPLELHVDEADIERRVVDHQPRLADEIEKAAGDLGEARLVGEETGGQPMNGDRAFGHVALGIDVDVIFGARRDAVQKLDTADLDDPVAAGRLQAGRFRIENDFAHHGPIAGSARAIPDGIGDVDIMAPNAPGNYAMNCIARTIAPTWRRAESKPRLVSTTKWARRRFSASGI